MKEKMKNERTDLVTDREELKRANEEDRKIINNENATSYEKTASSERVAQRDTEIRRLASRVEDIERDKPLLERNKEIFKKYGEMVTAILLAARITIGAVIGITTEAFKATGKALGNGLKALAKKPASLLPGLLASILSFRFKADYDTRIYQ